MFAQVSIGSSKVPLCNQLFPKPPTYSSIPLPWDTKRCSLVVITSGGGISYLTTTTKLMQDKGYVYSDLLDFLDNSTNTKKLLDFILAQNKPNKVSTYPMWYNCSQKLTPRVLWWFQAQNSLKTPLLKASYSFYFFWTFFLNRTVKSFNSLIEECPLKNP
jgi:hypothetical protein